MFARSPEATRALGARLGALLEGGEVVLLHGDLGAGKTVFVKGIARGLGIPEREVRSPTFTLVDHHERGRIPLIHIDAYRLGGPAELCDLGLDAILRPDAALVVEWAVRVEEVLPEDRLEVSIEHAGAEARAFRIEAAGPRSARLLAALGLEGERRGARASAAAGADGGADGGASGAAPDGSDGREAAADRGDLATPTGTTTGTATTTATGTTRATGTNDDRGATGRATTTDDEADTCCDCL